jgi:hypothetical protein
LWYHLFTDICWRFFALFWVPKQHYINLHRQYVHNWLCILKASDPGLLVFLLEPLVTRKKAMLKTGSCFNWQTFFEKYGRSRRRIRTGFFTVQIARHDDVVFVCFGHTHTLQLLGNFDNTSNLVDVIWRAHSIKHFLYVGRFWQHAILGRRDLAGSFNKKALRVDFANTSYLVYVIWRAHSIKKRCL